MPTYDIRLARELAEMLGLDVTRLVSFTLFCKARQLPVVRATYICDADLARRVTKRYRLIDIESTVEKVAG